MKNIKDRGREELLAFKNRVARSYGMGKIEKGDFDELIERVEDLLKVVEELDEQEE